MWTMLKRWLLGVSAKVWQFVLPLLKGAAMEFACDPTVQAGARDAVLAAYAKWKDKSGTADQKFEFAIQALKTTMLARGTEIARGYLALAVQTAYENLKAEKQIN